MIEEEHLRTMEGGTITSFKPVKGKGGTQYVLSIEKDGGKIAFVLQGTDDGIGIDGFGDPLMAPQTEPHSEPEPEPEPDNGCRCWAYKNGYCMDCGKYNPQAVI